MHFRETAKRLVVGVVGIRRRQDHRGNKRQVVQVVGPQKGLAFTLCRRSHEVSEHRRDVI